MTIRDNKKYCNHCGEIINKQRPAYWFLNASTDYFLHIPCYDYLYKLGSDIVRSYIK